MRRPSQKTVWVAIIGSCSLLVIGLSSVRVIEAFYLLPGNHIYEAIFSEDVSDLDLVRAIETRENALEVGGGDVATQLGTLRFLLARRVGVRTEAGRALLLSAKTVLVDGLSRSPADPFSWYRLAGVERALGDDSDGQKISRALVMSYYSGRFDPFLIVPRFRFAAHNWEYLSQEAQDLTIGQVPLLWDFAPKSVVNLAETEKLRLIIRAGLINSENELEAFELMINNSD